MREFPDQPIISYRSYACKKYYYTTIWLSLPLVQKYYQQLKAGKLLSKNDWKDDIKIDKANRHCITYPLAYGLCQLGFKRRIDGKNSDIRIRDNVKQSKKDI